MTKLTRLTIKNFKSFKKADIPISKGFTAIVGSNGSGKSNVLDALLFVLGITSLKTLRASKLTDLVNNNSNEGYAKVDLLLKHEDKQYELSRMIDRQGKSVYRLDGKRTTLNEVNSLLLELGIDISGHNIVTQGDITKIIEMSPLERRLIIDNIAGLSEFDQKKEEAIKELEKVDIKIKEATIIMNERNVFLAELEEEMKSAKEYNELEKEKKRIKATVIGRELYNIDKRMNEVNTEISELNKIKAESEEKVSIMRNELSELKVKSNEMNRQIMKDSESLYITIGRGLEEKKAKLGLEKEKISLQEDIISASSKKIEANKKSIQALEAQEIELKANIESIEKNIKDIESQVKELLAKKATIEKVVKDKGNEGKVLENSVDEINKQLESEKQKLFETSVFIEQNEKQKSQNLKNIEKLEKELILLNNSIEIINQKKNRINEITKGKDIEKELENFELNLQELNKAHSKTVALLEEARKSVQDLTKVSSKCPICDTDLQEEKKTQIVGHKKSHIDTLEKENDELIKKISSKVLEIKELKKNIQEANKLNVECSVENELLTKKQELSKQVTELNNEINKINLKDKLAEKEKLEQLTLNLQEQKRKAKEALNLFRSQDIFEEYSSINSQIEDSMNKRSLLESKIADIENELNKVLTKEESLFKENKEQSKILLESESEINQKKELMQKFEAEVTQKEAELKEAKKKSTAILSDKEKLDKNIERTEKEIMTESLKARKFELKVNDFLIEKSKIEVRQTDLLEEKKNYESEEQISEKSIDELKKRLETVEKRLLDIGAVNMKAVDNFNELKKEVEEIQTKANTLSGERLSVLDMIDKIEVKRTSVFMDCFNEVNKNFQEMFFKFFNGEGKLTFTDIEKPLDSGLIIEAKHKMNKLQNIDSMSGGEKTLTALAFMFAIQLYSPAPFYAFDEADAALDKENSAKMGNLIEMIAEKSQFISVTHNDTITKKADQIIGVALAKDGSSVIGLKLKNQQEQ